jgi:hypothetical protein
MPAADIALVTPVAPVAPVDLDAFPAARYRLHCVTEQPIHLPEYAGSALRGAFGHALRRAACVTRERSCEACALYRSCPYPAIFEPPPPLDYGRRVLSKVPAPFVVEPPPWGERSHPGGSALDFDLVLIGPALQQLPLILLAWRQALQRGLGPQQGSARLDRVSAEGEAEPVLEGAAGRIRLPMQPPQLPAAGAAPARRATLVFETPLRLARNGAVLGIGELTPQALLMALLRRVANLVELQLGGTLALDFAALNAHAGTIGGSHQFAWRDWTRHSSRQQQRMVLGGAVGTWVLEGDLAPFWPLLHLGQWLHVGKNASFGLGRYRLADAE